MTAALGWIRVGPGLMAVGLAFLVACSDGSSDVEPSPVDDTVREIAGDELSRMVLSLEQLGPDFEGFVSEEANGFLTLDSAAAEDFDPAAERADLEQSGWSAGYEQFFSDAQAIEQRSGVFQVGSSVGLFAVSDGANGYFQDSADEVGQDIGKTRNGATLNKLERFDVDIADAAAGARIEAHFEQELTEEERQQLEEMGQEPVSFDFWGAGVDFRHGRILATVAVFGIGLSDGEKERLEGRLTDLARKMNEQITQQLAGTPAPSGS